MLKNGPSSRPSPEFHRYPRRWSRSPWRRTRGSHHVEWSTASHLYRAYSDSGPPTSLFVDRKLFSLTSGIILKYLNKSDNRCGQFQKQHHTPHPCISTPTVWGERINEPRSYLAEWQWSPVWVSFLQLRLSSPPLCSLWCIGTRALASSDQSCVHDPKGAKDEKLRWELCWLGPKLVTPGKQPIMWLQNRDDHTVLFLELGMSPSRSQNLP